MKVAIFLEANLKNPGGYNQTLSTANFIYNSLNNKRDLVFIVNSFNLSRILKKKKINLINYKKNIAEKLFDFFLDFLFYLDS